MKRHDPDRDEMFAEEMINLFDTDDAALVLVGRAVEGVKGVHKLRLFDHRYAAIPAETKLASTTLAPTKASLVHLANVKGEIKEMKKLGVRFVVAYHICGTAEWALAWSGCSERTALAELCRFAAHEMYQEV